MAARGQLRAERQQSKEANKTSPEMGVERCVTMLLVCYRCALVHSSHRVELSRSRATGSEPEFAQIHEFRKPVEASYCSKNILLEKRNRTPVDSLVLVERQPLAKRRDADSA
ncbi:hypothetical protein FOZ61_008096 [Perkinsus olseni]|uniref:Uncharacterized protein n=1 Tax=Perkinsus olseni TaxID=32597 RepID=A0A7J6L665_PEROL|nr:hypothetical protein FOZ61_008096 [Perkinsus olseni]